MRFVIFTHVEHSKVGDDQFAYAPYIREMNLWLRQVEEVEIVAPLNNESQTSTAEAYRHDQVTFTAVPPFDLLTLKNSLRALFLFPLICTRILAAMHRADHLHLRCPGNIGLIACLCQIFFPAKPKTAKYAGNWNPEAKQPWTYKLQKWILSNTILTRNMQVLVYGEWAAQTKNIVPFFTASFSEKDIPIVEEKEFSRPFTFLFVGNLVEGKRPLEAVKLVEAINKKTVVGKEPEIRANFIRASLEIFGDGPEKEKLETYVREKRVEQFVTIKGSRPLEDLKGAYQKAHFVVLPSKSEGWPKALAEGMFFGCIPIATPVSCVPWMLGNGSRGIVLGENQESRTRNQDQNERTEDRGQWADIQDSRFKNQEGRKEWSVDSGQGTEDVKKISQLMDNPGEMKRMSNEAKQWSQQYTLERFEEAIKEVLRESKRKAPLPQGEAGEWDEENTFPGSRAGRQAGFRDGAKRGKSRE